MKTINIESHPSIALICFPNRYYHSVVWGIRRMNGTILDSDTRSGQDSIGSEDAELLKSAIDHKRWWLFDGGMFHFTFADTPLTTMLSLLQQRRGTVVSEIPGNVKFKAAVNPIGMCRSAVFNLASVYERLAVLFDKMKNNGVPPFQLLELLPCGAIFDFEFFVTGGDLLRMSDEVLRGHDVCRADVLLPFVVFEMLTISAKFYPAIFEYMKEKYL